MTNALAIVLLSLVTVALCVDYFTGFGGAAIEHDYTEAIMVAVNSTIHCAYCDGLHTELAELAASPQSAVKPGAPTRLLQSSSADTAHSTPVHSEKLCTSDFRHKL